MRPKGQMGDFVFILIYAATIYGGVKIAIRRNRWVAVPLVLFLPYVGFIVALCLGYKCKMCGTCYSFASECPACGTLKGRNMTGGKIVIGSMIGETDDDDNAMTQKQRGFIISLGGTPRKGMTKAEASTMIDELLEAKEVRRMERARRRVEENPYTQKDGEVALAFRVGGRYYHAGKNRVFECIAVKGKRARSVFFSALDAIERNRAWIEDDKKYGIVEGFNKVRIEDGVETADRGNLRADRFATNAEVADELEFLKGLRERTQT